MEIVLNLWINLGTTATLIVFQWHRMPFHSLGSPLICVTDVLQFSVYKSYTPFIIFDAIIYGIVYLISLGIDWPLIEVQLIFLYWSSILQSCWTHLLALIVFLGEDVDFLMISYIDEHVICKQE